MSLISEQKFTQEVLNSPTPVLVHFWAPWCGLCRMIQPLLANFQTEHPNQIKVVGINADENLKLANTYRLTTLPTLLFFENGQLSHRLDSFRGRDDLREALEAILQSRTSTSTASMAPVVPTWLQPATESLDML